MRIGLITSPGGHFFSLYNLKPWWRRYDRFWVTEKRQDTEKLLRHERLYSAYFPEHRNLINFFRNLGLAFFILRKERPDLLISTGAGIAPPFFFTGKLLGIKLVFIETWDYIFWPTISGKLIYPIADKFLIQNKRQKKFYPKAEYWGTTL